MTTTSPSFKPSRPTIGLDGTDDADLAQGLLSMSIHEDVLGLYRCEATFGNWGDNGGKLDFLYFDRQKLEFGRTLRVKIGTDVFFQGKIYALEARFPESQPAEITVLAEDALQDFRLTRRSRAFENVTDSDVFNQIAGEHSLSPSVDVSGASHTVLAQVNQSDLAFLRDRARAIEAELWIDGTTLNVKSRAKRSSAAVSMSYHREIREFTVVADLANQRSSVVASGWDVANKDVVKYEASDSVLGSELGSDASGASVLSAKLAAKKDVLAHTAPRTSQEAQTQAEGYFRMMARRFVVGHGIAETDIRVRVGRTLSIQGLGPLFTGNYYLTEVKHVFDGGAGIRTEFWGERPGLGQP